MLNLNHLLKVQEHLKQASKKSKSDKHFEDCASNLDADYTFLQAQNAKYVEQIKKESNPEWVGGYQPINLETPILNIGEDVKFAEKDVSKYSQHIRLDVVNKSALELTKPYLKFEGTNVSSMLPISVLLTRLFKSKTSLANIDGREYNLYDITVNTLYRLKYYHELGSDKLNKLYETIINCANETLNSVGTDMFLSKIDPTFDDSKCWGKDGSYTPPEYLADLDIEEFGGEAIRTAIYECFNKDSLNIIKDNLELLSAKLGEIKQCCYNSTYINAILDCMYPYINYEEFVMQMCNCWVIRNFPSPFARFETIFINNLITETEKTFIEIIFNLHSLNGMTVEEFKKANGYRVVNHETPQDELGEYDNVAGHEEVNKFKIHMTNIERGLGLTSMDSFTKIRYICSKKGLENFDAVNGINNLLNIYSFTEAKNFPEELRVYSDCYLNHPFSNEQSDRALKKIYDDLNTYIYDSYRSMLEL